MSVGPLKPLDRIVMIIKKEKIKIINERNQKQKKQKEEQNKDSHRKIDIKA